MTLRRYFGMITTWYLHSHRTWDRLCHSCIGSSFLPPGAFPEGGAYPFHGGMHAASLEALRVTRPEAVGLGRTNPRISDSHVMVRPFSCHQSIPDKSERLV